MLTVALLADYREEGWASMDLTADMLLEHLQPIAGIQVRRISPPFRHRLGRLTSSGGAVADRIVNRFFDYPRWLRSEAPSADVYHVVDHSYAHLVSSLPRDRTIVTCHDVDAFRPFTAEGSQSKLPLPLARRVLRGLRRARYVTCISQATRSELIGHQFLPPDRVVVVPLGVHPSCSAEPNPEADREAATLLGDAGQFIDLLHVGTTVERKRVDIAIETTAVVARRFDAARLVRVGGALTAVQRAQARSLGIADRVLELPFLSREVLAAVYRRAALVLMPSDREGFGLPVVEALACGAPVVASGIAALREVGGEVTTFCPPGHAAVWGNTVADLLTSRSARPLEWRARQAAGVAHAQRFTWARTAAVMAGVYRSMIDEQVWAPTG